MKTLQRCLHTSHTVSLLLPMMQQKWNTFGIVLFFFDSLSFPQSQVWLDFFLHAFISLCVYVSKCVCLCVYMYIHHTQASHTPVADIRFYGTGFAYSYELHADAGTWTRVLCKNKCSSHGALSPAPPRLVFVFYNLCWHFPRGVWRKQLCTVRTQLRLFRGRLSHL